MRWSYYPSELPRATRSDAHGNQTNPLTCQAAHFAYVVDCGEHHNRYRHWSNDQPRAGHHDDSRRQNNCLRTPPHAKPVTPISSNEPTCYISCIIDVMCADGLQATDDHGAKQPHTTRGLCRGQPEHCLGIPGVGAGQVRVDAVLDSVIQRRGCSCPWWCPELLLNNGGLFHLANLAQVSLEVDFHPDITLQVFCLDHCHGNIGLHRR